MLVLAQPGRKLAEISLLFADSDFFHGGRSVADYAYGPTGGIADYAYGPTGGIADYAYGPTEVSQTTHMVQRGKIRQKKRLYRRVHYKKGIDK